MLGTTQSLWRITENRHVIDGNLGRLTDPLNQAITSEFDPNGQLTHLTQNGVISDFGYDGVAREISADYKNGLTVNYQHDSQLDWNQVNGPTLGTMGRQFDDDGRLAGWSLQSGAAPSFGYDESGRLKSEVGAAGQTTTYGYLSAALGNNANHRVDITVPGQSTPTTYNYYDAAGNLTTQLTGGYNHRQEYYPDGRIKRVYNPRDDSWHWDTEYKITRDSSGSVTANQVIVTDPLSRKVTTDLNPWGLPTDITGATCCGNLHSEYLFPTSIEEGDQYPTLIRDAGGHERRFTYFQQGESDGSPGQLKSSTDLGGNIYTFKYFKSTHGNLQEVSGPAVQLQGQSSAASEKLLSYEYDGQERLWKTHYAGLTNPKQLNYGTTTVGAQHLPSKIHLPKGSTIEMDYDGAGRITERRTKNDGGALEEKLNYHYRTDDSIDDIVDNTTSSPQVLNYLYDSAMQAFSGINFPNGATLRYHEDTSGRTDQIQARASANGTLYQTQYYYDGAGNIDRMDMSLNGQSYRIDFVYDAVNRLTSRCATTSGLKTLYRYTYLDANSQPVDPDNMVREIEHQNAGGDTLIKVTWRRIGNGEPDKITREDGSYALLGYQSSGDTGHHLLSEGFYNNNGTIQQGLGYSYNTEGNRSTKVVGSQSSSYAYGPGGQLISVSGASSESYGYDAGGATTTVSRNSVSQTLAFDSVDRLTGITGVIGYQYDSLGQRKSATPQGGTARQFVTGPTLGLPSPHLILDASGNVVQGYVYGPKGEPILRFDASGNVTYYLEDQIGNIIGLAGSNPTIGNITKFYYDGFGNLRPAYGTTPGSVSLGTGVPSGTGGDYRFQGQWLDSESGFCHMRAREYDPGSGRFLTRDPEEGDPRGPETMSVYSFANGNPYFYSDPSGGFTVTEISFTSSEQFAGQSLRAAGAQAIKQRVRRQLTQIITDELERQLKNLVPKFDLPFPTPGRTGDVFEQFARDAFRRFFCKSSVVPEWIFLDVPIRTDGTPLADGISCNRDVTAGEKAFNASLGAPRPDFVLGSNPPTQGGSWLVGDFKGRTGTFYREYLKPGTVDGKKQFSAILNYARKRTYSKTALFVVATGRNSTKPSIIRAELGKQGLANGTMVLLVTIVD